MAGRSGARGARRGRTSAVPGALRGAPPVALAHPWMLAAILATTAATLLAVTFEVFDTDFWQHLLVGRFIWERHALPTLQLWTWPTYGAPDVNASWGFRALVWPFWSVGGVEGLFVWRWLTTLAALGVLWALGRRMGGRGFSALVALLTCAMVYRMRTQIRPETLVAVLLALQLWVLESRRQGGRDLSMWLVPIAWAWANAHISWYLGFVLTGTWLLDDLLRARAGDAAAGARARRLSLVALLAFAISFVNPWGWRALWQPFEYFLFWRHEPIFQTIIELRPVNWREQGFSWLAALVLGWPVLIALRARRRAFDRVEAILCLGFTALALLTQRFIGVYALVAAPFVMRGVSEWVTTQEWPGWSVTPAARAAALLLLCAAVAVGEVRRVDPPLRVGIAGGRYPVRACDIMAQAGIGGRGFNNFEFGGYQAFRFWPDRERLPFIDVHQAGTTLDRRLYVGAFRSAEGWRALDERHHFDYALLTRDPATAARLPDILDADSTWALVFADDAATLHVRRAGALAAVAERLAYRHLPAGSARLGPLGIAVAGDSTLRAGVTAELGRQIAESPRHAGALSLLANIALADGRFDEARRLLQQGLALSPGLGRAHERLGRIALEQGRPREALRELQRERALHPERPGVALLIGSAWRRLGDPRRAREWYRRELRADPASAEARDSLAALGAGPAR